MTSAARISRSLSLKLALSVTLLFIAVGGAQSAFTELPEFGTGYTLPVAWGDADGDGHLDVAVGNYGGANRLFINNGDGTFTAMPAFGSGQTDSVVWGDFDSDGDPDLAVGNGGFNHAEPNYLYINDGLGGFVEQAQFGGEDTACLSWADADNDGDLDLAVGNWENGASRLYVNQGNGTFAEELAFGNRDTNTLAWGDADNDGDLDVAVGNGDFQSAEQNYLYRNHGDGSFAEEEAFGLGSTDGVAWGDCDEDGDLDLAVGNEHHPLQNYLYLNEGITNSYLGVRLVGQFHASGTGFSNRDGIGGRVFIYTAGRMGERSELLGMREICAHGGFASQNPIAAHFGVGTQAEVDLRIIWPGSGGYRVVQEVAGVATGQTIAVIETGEPAAAERSEGLEGSLLWFRASPQPATGPVELYFHLPDRSASELAVYDVAGQLVQRLPAEPLGNGGAHRAVWQGRTLSDQLAPSGIYWVCVRGIPHGIRGRVVRLR